MRIITIQHNEFTNQDFAVYFKDNCPDDPDLPPTPPRNTTHLIHTQSGLPVLQVEFWRKDRLLKYFWQGEPISFVIDEDTGFYKNGSKWPELMEIYDSY